MEVSRTRLIGKHTGEGDDVLLICFGAMHGNEPAGLRAIELVLKMLEIEPFKNDNFKFHGRLVGLIGNLEALRQQKRFLEKDLNRMFIEDYIQAYKQMPRECLINERKEIIELLDCVEQEIKEFKPRKVVFLDLHTTSSPGGIFTICRRNDEAIRIAQSLHAPVVLGMLDGLRGTTLHYFTKENTGVDTIALTFESGQHEERLSVNRAIAGIISIMREIGMISPEDVENYHEEVLIEFTQNLPTLTTLVDRYDIQENDGFRMRPGFNNFQFVEKGEWLAMNSSGRVHAAESGRILMPLYQDQGEDGYFIIKDLGDDFRITN